MAQTLRRRMIVSLGLILLGTMAMGTGSIIAVAGMHRDLGVAAQGYRQLRQLFSIGYLASKAREAISGDPPRPQMALSALNSTLATLDERSGSVDGPPERWVNESARQKCRQLITEAIDQWNRDPQNVTSINLVFRQLSSASDEVRGSITEAQRSADRRQQLALMSILGLNVFVIAGTVLLGIRQYRGVIVPVHRMRDGVRAFAMGRLDQRISLHGDREFVTLAADFNQMAEDLSVLYLELEAKVAAKSKELVRTRHLVGVGYLAAGVAHEINNPLGIITGYSEQAIQRLSGGVDEASLAQTQKAFSIICEEAFRCKQITSRLLSLARPCAENRQVISIEAIVQGLISTLSGLGTAGRRTLTLTADPKLDWSVTANEGEVKQLLLNLLLNAIEAVDPQTGNVRVTISRHESEIELSVTDNGHGMTSDVIDHLFQPFFSKKPSHQHGTGLGLCIAQAIAADHGGIIHGKSVGPNTGSTFTFRLPAAKKGVASCQHLIPSPFTNPLICSDPAC